MNYTLININAKLQKYLGSFAALFLLILSQNITSAQTRTEISQKPDREKLRRYISTLGSDEFMGRGTGQPGGYMAAEYLAGKFKETGLKEIDGMDNYYQNVHFHEIEVQPSTELNFFTENDTVSPVLNLDYLIHKSGGNSVFHKPVEMVFAGYGIVAPEFDYNDYRNVDVVNKVVIMFSGEPKSEDSEYFYGDVNSKYSQIDIKQRIALAHGAKACVIIPNPDDFSYQTWGNEIQQYSFSELALAYSPSDIFTILILPEIAEKIFKHEKYDLAALNEMFTGNKLKSFEMKSSMSFKGVYKDRSFSAPNIIGYIEGSDKELKNTYVLVTAHYDHLGIGPAIRNDSIYNGVLDNAMGTAALLEIARIMNSSPIKPLRSVIFMLTTAEEKGLLGSLNYINNPPFPLYKTIANINIDGLAFIDNFKSVVGVGINLSDLGEFVTKTAVDMNLKVEDFPQEFKEIESFNRSDQIAFASVGIPALLVMDGTEYVNIKREYGLLRLMQYMASIYHTPFDDLEMMINYDAAVQHTQFLLNLITNIAQSDTEPEWKNWTEYYYERTKLRNEKR